MIAAIYIGFAVADGRAKVIAVESTVAFAFVLVAMAAITGSAWLLVVGLFGQGLKDLWQHRTEFVRRHALVAALLHGRGLCRCRGDRHRDRRRSAVSVSGTARLGTKPVLVPISAYIRVHPHPSDLVIDAYPCLRVPRFAIRRSAVRARLAPFPRLAVAHE